MGSGLSIELGHDSLYESNLRELERILTHIKMQDRELTELDLSNRFLGFGGARVSAEPLARARTLTHLNLSYNQLGGTPQKKKYGRPRPAAPPQNTEEIGIPYIADALARNSALIYLNLAGNNLGAKGMHNVSQMLRKNKRLEELILYNNGIGDESMPDLCDALASNTTLYKLNLDYNDITDAGAELLHKMFDTNQTLTHLSLKDNENISAAWLQRIEECLERNREVQERERAVREEQERQERQRQEYEDQQRAEKEEKIRLERERIEREYHELEARKREEEEEQARLDEEAYEKRERRRAAHEARLMAHEEHIDNLVNLSYAWRETLRGGEQRGREWRSGFDSYKVTTTGKNGFSPPPPAGHRLVACWCEPTEQTVAYPGQLHYHCIYEPQPTDAQHYEEGKSHKYQGCFHTAHRCRSAPMSYIPDRNQGSLFAPAGEI